MAVGPQPVDLDEGAGQLLRFPRRGRLARPQPHGDILDPHRLSRAQREVADDAVALIEQPQHGNPLRHRRHAGLLRGRARYVDRDRLVLGRLLALVAAGDKQQGEREDGGEADHAYSGFHAS